MKARLARWSLAVTLLLVLFAASAVRADDLIVEHNPPANNPTHFSTIQAALDYAAVQLSNILNKKSFTVKVQADPTPYIGGFKAISNVPIIGTSTAGTFINGPSTAPLVTISGVDNVAIRNLTFKGSSGTAISILNSSAIDITNNVFNLGKAATAIAVVVDNSSTTSVTNDTFYNNNIAISTNSDITISNDIFSQNNIAISSTVTLNALTYSDFFLNGSNGVATLGAFSIPSQAVANPDPQFVDAVGGDFHLKAGSPAKASGNLAKYPNSFDKNTSDMGAYGGPFADLAQSTITGVTSAPTSTGTGVVVSWNPTSDPTVTFYRVYFGTASRTYSGFEGGPASPISVPVGTNQATIENVALPAPTKPAAPTLISVTPSNQSLFITWSPVGDATAYRIYFSTTPFTATTPPTTFVDIGAASTTFQLPGLTNGTTYYVAVAALSQARLFMSVTAVKDINVTSNPGSSNETPFSAETSQGFGTPAVSDISSVGSDFPEATVAFPNLKGEGCFIATAAYGFYSAPQVQALRDFRDRYLMTNAPGRAFVAWYYRHGPKGAHFLNAHPWLKAPVRLALFPLVALAFFMVYMPPLGRIATIMIMVIIADFLSRRIKRKGMVRIGGGS